MKILDHLIQSVRKAGEYNRNDISAPLAVVWTDGDKAWKRAAQHIAKAMPEFLMLADTTGENQGPSTWIRYQISRRKFKSPPIVYLPGVSRQHFRSAEGFPEIARNLYPLQFLGQFWLQANGKDWTPSAFLSSENSGLGLDLARDKATGEALLEQLENLIQTDLEILKGKKLEAGDFYEMGAGDSERMLLEWIDNPKKAEKSWEADEKSAFHALCRKDYGFDPFKDGVVTAIEKLVGGHGKWANLWRRFEDSYSAFKGIPKALESYRSKDLLPEENIRIHSVNKAKEFELKEKLGDLKDLASRGAREALAKLADEHVPRADSLWGKLGQAPLAQAVKHLQACSERISAGVAGNDWKDLAESYLLGGWLIDAEARRAVAAVRLGPDLKAVTGALQAIYRPWIEELAQRVQGWVQRYPNAKSQDAISYAVENGTVYLFVDGLRADLGQELADELKKKGSEVNVGLSWAALPTVTATAKPAWKPMVDMIQGVEVGKGFEPSLAKGGKSFQTLEFRKALKELGYELFKSSDNGNPAGCGWTETGSFDKHGHAEGIKLAFRIQEEMESLISRIEELADAGWKKIVVVTDHGWLWIPGELPKVNLPKHLTSSQWGRCAVPNPGTQHELPRVGWFWNRTQEVALAPGIGNFKSGEVYAHGGMTLQECLVLRIEVKPPENGSAEQVTIESAKWAGLRLTIKLKGAHREIGVDIRTRAGDPGSSVLSQLGKKPNEDGVVALVVEKDDLEGQAAFLVLLNGDEVLVKHKVTIGED